MMQQLKQQLLRQHCHQGLQTAVLLRRHRPSMDNFLHAHVLFECNFIYQGVSY